MIAAGGLYGFAKMVAKPSWWQNLHSFAKAVANASWLCSNGRKTSILLLE